MKLSSEHLEWVPRMDYDHPKKVKWTQCHFEYPEFHSKIQLVHDHSNNFTFSNFNRVIEFTGKSCNLIFEEVNLSPFWTLTFWTFAVSLLDGLVTLVVSPGEWAVVEGFSFRSFLGNKSLHSPETKKVEDMKN